MGSSYEIVFLYFLHRYLLVSLFCLTFTDKINRVKNFLDMEKEKKLLSDQELDEVNGGIGLGSIISSAFGNKKKKG